MFLKLCYDFKRKEITFRRFLWEAKVFNKEELFLQCSRLNQISRLNSDFDISHVPRFSPQTQQGARSGVEAQPR